MTVEVFAPAKINLTLHITGQRADGYHELDSLVAFADVGDTIRISEFSSPVSSGQKGVISVSGSESGGVPQGADNIVAKALDFVILDRIGPDVSLEKNLPLSSGIGGGSSDAAATIRAIAYGRDMDSAQLRSPGFLERLSKEIGADVPVCLDPRPWRATGIGEKLAPVQLPKLFAVLVNPRVQVSTPQVFGRLESRSNGPMGWPPDTRSVAAFCDWLNTNRNDLEEPARQVAPAIDDVLRRLRKLPGVLLVRMSGSGATCFGIFETAEAAKEAEEGVKWFEPSWWVRAVTLGDMSENAAPRVT